MPLLFAALALFCYFVGIVKSNEKVLIAGSMYLPTVSYYYYFK